VGAKKKLSIFFIVLIIVSIIEASILLYIPIEKPSKKSAVKNEKLSLHLCYAKTTVYKPKPKIEPKPIPKPKLTPKPKQKPKPKPKPKTKIKPKPVQKKVVKQPKPKEKKEQHKTVQNPQPKSVQSSPKRCKPSAQKVDRAKMDVVKAAYLKEVHELIEFNKYYPRRAKRMHRSGVVEIEFTIQKMAKLPILIF